MFKTKLASMYVILSGICLLLLFIGCQSAISSGIERTIPSETVSNDGEVALLDVTMIAPTRSISQTIIPTQTPVSTITSSPTPQLTRTLQPTPTPSPTETAMPTPWPTLPPDEAADKVLALLADNQNPDCLLPCWWGATPGQTRWQDIEPFLNSFALAIDFFPEHSMYAAMFPVREDINYRGRTNMTYRIDAAEIITAISVAPNNTTGYDPRTMMTLYGVPDEVWLTTMAAPREGILPFQLIVVYQQQGISFRYYVDAASTYETVTACFEPGVVETERPDLFPAGPRIYLWAPGQHKTIDEIANIPDERYFPLEEKTGLTPQTLYEKFTDPNEQPCIDTPADLWIAP
jgi:hypothetical protein